MKKTPGVWRQRVKQLIFAGVALPVVLAVIAVFQVVFFPVSKEDAISKATNEFHKFCHTEGLNPDFFEGPSIDPASGNSVFFSGGYYLTWFGQGADGEQFTVDVLVDRTGWEELWPSSNIEKLRLRHRIQ